MSAAVGSTCIFEMPRGCVSFPSALSQTRLRSGVHEKRCVRVVRYNGDVPPYLRGERSSLSPEIYMFIIHGYLCHGRPP